MSEIIDLKEFVIKQTLLCPKKKKEIFKIYNTTIIEIEIGGCSKGYCIQNGIDTINKICQKEK